MAFSTIRHMERWWEESGRRESGYDLSIQRKDGKTEERRDKGQGKMKVHMGGILFIR